MADLYIARADVEFMDGIRLTIDRRYQRPWSLNELVSFLKAYERQTVGRKECGTQFGAPPQICNLLPGHIGLHEWDRDRA